MTVEGVTDSTFRDACRQLQGSGERTPWPQRPRTGPSPWREAFTPALPPDAAMGTQRTALRRQPKMGRSVPAWRTCCPSSQTTISIASSLDWRPMRILTSGVPSSERWNADGGKTERRASPNARPIKWTTTCERSNRSTARDCRRQSLRMCERFSDLLIGSNGARQSAASPRTSN